MKALSLFSGIGGLDLAAEAAGIETAAFCEKDPFCRRVLAKHWPCVPVHDDVFTLRGEEIADTIDVIHGGFPCQPFSVAGRQRGRDDERYLWPEFSRLVGELEPLWVVAENVPGIFTDDVAGDVCADLERLGYAVGIWCYEAAAVGAPHRRMRVFFVGHAEGVGQRRFQRRQAKKEPENGSKNVPDGRRGGCVYGPDEKHPSKARVETLAVPAYGGAPISDAESGGRYDGGDGEDFGASAGKIHASDDAGHASFSSAGHCSWWFSEPDVGRVAYGISHRMDRLRALGNAVVPQQAYPIFRAIAEMDRLLKEGERRK